MLTRFFRAFALSLYAFSSMAGTQAVPPTINVRAYYEEEVAETIDGPPGLGRVHISWNTTNADYVLIIRLDNRKYPPSGTEFFSGDHIVVAVGPGGMASEFVGAHVNLSLNFHGRYGLVYNFDSGFSMDSFLRDSYKDSFTTSKSMDELRKIGIRTLQDMEYTVGTKELGDKVCLYTVNYNFNESLAQSEKDRRGEGQVQRQIAFIVCLEPGGTAISRKLFVLPMVQRNFPRDNALWSSDSDSVQVGIPASQRLARKIIDASR